MSKTQRQPLEKARFFTFLLYEDSAPKDYEAKLESLGQPMAISPWHDNDIVQTREMVHRKKKHKHVIYVANNNVTANAVRNKLKRALGEKAVAMVQIVDNIENMYLYLTHESKDAIAKNKTLYNKADIVHLNNFDIDRYTVIDVEQKRELLGLVVQVVRMHGLCNMPDLFDFIDEQGEGYGLTIRLVEEVVKTNSGYMKLWFDGNYQRYKRSRVEISDLLKQQYEKEEVGHE